MSQNTTKKATMGKETIIYMIAKAIEGIVGIVTMSAMTYLYIDSQMGLYNNANIIITTVGMVAIQWLVQSVLRYINKYDIEGRHQDFYSTVFSAWLKVNVISVVIAFIFYAIAVIFFRSTPIVQKFMSIYSERLLICCVLWLVTYNTAQLMISMLAAIREAKLNLLLSVITVCGRLVLMVAFCLMWGNKVEWIFLSYFLTDLAVSVIGAKRLKIFSYIKGKADKAILKELKDYGMPLMGNQLATSCLTRSDALIVTAALGLGASGVYQTNYSLISTAFTLLNASVMRGCYPTILRAWSEGRKGDVQVLLNQAVRMYMLVAIPAVAGVFAVSDAAARALFEKSYFQGHIVMFWVALGMMFLGLTEYSIKHWELSSNTGAIFKRSLISGVMKVVLFYIVIKITDSYAIAAVTTFIGFFAYFIMARWGTRKYLKWTIEPKRLFRILFSAIVMVIVIELLKLILPDNKLCLAIFVFCGIIVYGIVLWITGEIKEELAVIGSRIKK